MIVKLLEPVEYLDRHYQAGDVIRVKAAVAIEMIHDHVAAPLQQPVPKQVIKPAETRQEPTDGG